MLARRAQECSLGYQLKFGSNGEVSLTTLVSELALVMQEYTHMAGVRPFGVALLVAGVDAERSKPKGKRDDDAVGNPTIEQSSSRLYRVEPSGRYSAWKAAAVGKGSGDAEDLLQEHFEEGMDRDAALELALSVVLRCTPNCTTREDVEIAIVTDGNVPPQVEHN